MFNKEKPVKIIIDKEKCTKCGLCIKNCAGEYLELLNEEITAKKDSIFGCIQCGYCMMSCPTNAICIEGEGISCDKLIKIPTKSNNFEELYSLLIKRRSTRKFTEQKVKEEDIQKILEAASTGPISIPPHEVKVLVINDSKKVQSFANDILDSFEKMSKIFTPFILKLLKPFLGQNTFKMFNDFVVPLIKIMINERKEGRDILLYNAPAVLIFYTSEIFDKEDAIISATLASIAAESLNLGTCIIGSVPPAINKNPKLKQKYGLAKDEMAVMAIILGHPEKHFNKCIKRDFKQVRYF